MGFYSSPAKPLKRTTSTRRRARKRKTTQTLIPPRSRTHRSASSSSSQPLIVRYPLSLPHQQTKTISVKKRRCVRVCHVQRSYCIFSHFFIHSATLLNPLTMLLDKYAKSVPSKDVYFVALFYYY